MLGADTRRAAFLGLLLVVAGVYARAAGAEFFWDDHDLILRNPIVTELRVGQAIFGDLWAGAERVSPYWRPLAMLSFMLDYRLFGLGAWGYHLDSLAWHVVATALVASLASVRLGWERGVVSGLIFGLHPVQSETVLWIAARNDLMCAVGVAGCLWAVERERLGAAAAFAALAALSKELGFLLPLDVVLWRLAWGGRPPLRALAVVSGAVAAVGAMRLGIDLASANAPGELPFGAWPVAWRASVLAASWTVLPWPLTSTSSVFVDPSPSQWLAAALAAVLAVACVRAAPRRSGALLSIAAINWAPTLVAMFHNGLFGERYLYVPMAFLAVTAVAFAPSGRGALAAVAAPALAALVALGVRLDQWDTELVLLEAAVAHTRDGHTQVRYANQLERAGRVRDAFHAYRAALDWEPPPRVACGDPVRVLLGVGAYEEAGRLSDELLVRGCGSDSRFGIQRGRALVLAGRAEDAARELRPASGPIPTDELPIRAAICADIGNWSCESAIAMDWPGGPSDLRVYVFDLLHPPRPPPKKG